MASVLKLKTDIKKLKAAIASKATSGAIKTKLRGKLTTLENELDKLQPNKRKPKTTGPKSESALVKLAKKRRTNQGLSTSKIDIERDSIRPAKKAGKRISANGNRYYEYRDNRVDNRQPPKKYRKLADGGGTSDGWYEDFNDGFEKLVTKKYITQAEYEKYQEILNQVDPIDKYGKMSGRAAAKKFVDDNKRYIKMADGGEVEHWGVYVDDKLVEKFPTEKEAFEASKFYRRKSYNPFGIKVKKLSDGGYMADGGSVAKGNYEMLLSQAKEVMHHAKELMNVAKPDLDVEAWVVAKAERAATDLSDITHYLDGLKMSMGGMVKHNTHKVNA